MYDFLKVEIKQPGFAEELKKNSLLNFIGHHDINTGEVKQYFKSDKYENMEFYIYSSGRVEMHGSIHKFWNNGYHNYNDFNLIAVNEAISKLERVFNIDPRFAILHNLEIGLNIHTPYLPKDLIKNIVVYKGKSLDRMPGIGRQIKLNNYKLKIYDKSFQYKQPENILRFERKVIAMIDLLEGPLLLEDLKNADFAKYCLDKLIDMTGELVITEKVDNSKLSIVDRRVLNICNNPLNWENMDRTTKSRKKKQFVEIINKAGQQKLKAKLIELLKQKRDFLLSPAKKNVCDLTPIALINVCKLTGS